VYNVNFALTSVDDKKQAILNEVSDYDIYAFYLGHAFEAGKLFSSPFRRDLRPSFGIFLDRVTGKLIYNDFGDINKKGDCFRFVEQLLGLTYRKAQDRIYIDIIANNKHGKQTIVSYKHDDRPQLTKLLQYVPKDKMSYSDRMYWKEIGIDEWELPFFKIYTASSLFIDSIEVWKYEEDNPIFIYKVFDKIKAYRPLAKDKKNKWFSNCTRFDIQGWEQLPKDSGEDTLIITKSKKDVAVLRKLGYLAIAPSSESTMIPSNAMRILKEEYGFKKFILLYDRDDGGMKGARKMFTQYRGLYNISFKFIPKSFPKDVSAVRRQLGKESTTTLLIKLLGYVPNEKLTVLPTYETRSIA
jgi:5S rRNA maturation endonuclease (ribonuclease M5)